tara:strand:+ start:1236 stop:1355 length:120 start_codon:yes stop_codon:yes gene_type:complete
MDSDEAHIEINKKAKSLIFLKKNILKILDIQSKTGFTSN